MADKHTKRELFETLLVFASAAEADAWVIDGIQHELDLLAKRAGAKTTDVKRKAEQDAVKEQIASTLADGGEMRATAIAEMVGVSVQKVTSLVKQMVEDGTVIRNEDKKVTTFALATE